jgi:hypothetical protein
MANFKIDPSYKEVVERIADLKVKHPSAGLRPLNEDRPYDIVVVDGKTFIVVTAACIIDGEVRGVGNAWEPFPGATPYTKNSELQNAETSAWGRAIVAALASESKAIASAEDVRNRADDGDSIPNDGLPPDGVRPRPGVPTTENPAQEEVPPVPEGWTNHEVCMAAHDALNERVKKLSTEQKAECSKLRQNAGGGWPLSLAGYESLAHFTTACEAFGDGAVPAAGAEVAATPDGF